MEGVYKGHCLCIISNELSSFHGGQKCVYRDVWGGEDGGDHKKGD